MTDTGAVRVRFFNRNDTDVCSKAGSDTELIVSFGDNASLNEVEEAFEADDEYVPSKPTNPTAEQVFLKNNNDFFNQNSSIPDSVYMPSSITADSDSLDANAINSSKLKNNSFSDVEILFTSFLNFVEKRIILCNTFYLVQKIKLLYGKVMNGQFRLIWASLPICVFYFLPGILYGFFLGVYFSTILFFYICVSNPVSKITVELKAKDQLLKELKYMKKQDCESNCIYKGWMNMLNEPYNPRNFHVNTIQTVLVRLDGSLLRISRPDRSLLKHAFHNDPSLTEPEPRMISQNIYDLTNATVKLRPKRLALRRWFSRKYPIYIRLSSEGQRQRFSQKQSTNQKKKNYVSKSKSYANTLPNTSFSKSEKKSSGFDNSGSNLNKNNVGLNESTTLCELAQEADLFISDTSSSCCDYDYNDILTFQSVSEFRIAKDNLKSSALHSSRQNLLSNRKHFSSLIKSKSSQKIFLFARSAREKEQWFHRLRKACSKNLLENSLDKSSFTSKNFKLQKDSTRCRFLSLPDFGWQSSGDEASINYLLYILNNMQFSKHLEDILPCSTLQGLGSVGGIVSMDLGQNKWVKQKNNECLNTGFIVIVNLLATRIFYDFCRDEYWCSAVQKKIQTKLATIHLPYFIETLELSNFDIGTAIPKILDVYSPVVDSWGIWIDFEVKYGGLIKLVIETKVNLMKFKEHGEDAMKNLGPFSFCSSSLRTTLSRYSDDELPESPETSPDEEFGSKTRIEEPVESSKKTAKKILNFVDKITQSKYFKEASELKPIRKMMAEISSTRLILNVEITSLEGTMTINLPSPPSDRLWYGFRKPPKMSVKAIPQVGDRFVAISALSDWIETKISLLLEKNLVCPNLNDVVIPVLSGNTLLKGLINL